MSNEIHFVSSKHLKKKANSFFSHYLNDRYSNLSENFMGFC